MTFDQFFSTAFGKDLSPFAYQQALANRGWPDALIAPTGLGKTAAVVLGWAWQHIVDEYAPPRRLVYCLPMRTLVDQTGWKRPGLIEASDRSGYIGGRFAISKIAPPSPHWL